MNIAKLPYPIPTLDEGANIRGFHAHFQHLKADPPPQLVPMWNALAARRMAGQNVDADCADLLHLERLHNAGASLTPSAPKPETVAQRALRTFKEAQVGK